MNAVPSRRFAADLARTFGLVANSVPVTRLSSCRAKQHLLSRHRPALANVLAGRRCCLDVGSCNLRIFCLGWANLRPAARWGLILPPSHGRYTPTLSGRRFSSRFETWPRPQRGLSFFAICAWPRARCKTVTQRRTALGWRPVRSSKPPFVRCRAFVRRATKVALPVAGCGPLKRAGMSAGDARAGARALGRHCCSDPLNVARRFCVLPTE